MAVNIDVRYEGDLHCRATHGPSGDQLLTDAPLDNEGRGEHFSPTDLVATSIGTCTMTIMGIAARNHAIDISGATAQVSKQMGARPRRHIARLTLRFRLPADLDERQRSLLERAAKGCPVIASLGPLTQVDLSFDYR